MELAGSEPLGFNGCVSQRHTAIAQCDEFFRGCARSVGADRRASASGSAACAGNSGAEHQQCGEYGGFEYERCDKHCTGENSTACDDAAAELRCKLSSREHNAGADSVANL